MCRRDRCVDAIIVQNAVSHEAGLGSLWETRRRYWANRGAHVEKLRANLISPEVARQRHLGNDPHPEQYDPDAWTDESAFLCRPGQDRIQEDLFYDYRTNVAAYPTWQAYLREQPPPLLVLGGEYDPSFTVEGRWLTDRMSRARKSMSSRQATSPWIRRATRCQPLH